MIYPSGYVPFNDVLANWLARAKTLQSIKQEKEGHWESVFVEFLNDLGDEIPAYIVGTDATCLRIVSEVFRTFTRGEIESDFPSFEYDLEEADEFIVDFEEKDAIDFDDLTEFLLIPHLDENFFLYFNPVLSSVDASGFRFIKKLLAKDYSVLEHGCLEIRADANKDEPVLNFMNANQLSKLIGYRDIAEGFESVIFSRPGFGLDQYEGRSICFHAEEVSKYIEDNYPLGEKEISRLISAEREAERAFRAFMEDKNLRLRREDAKRMFCSKLGSRASKRVWDSVAKDYPFLSAPGRHKVSATALPYAARLDVWLKCQGMRSSMRDFGCPSRMA